MRHPRPAPLHFQESSVSPVQRRNGPCRSPLTTTARIALAILILAAGVAGMAPNASAQANVNGTWQTLSTTMPINPVHVALMHTGKVLIVSGSGNYPPDTSYMAAVWDPTTDTVTTMPITWDMFCNGMVVMPDGRPFVMGGTVQYDPFYGQARTSAFNPTTGNFADQQSMADGRWYPTGLVLGDGRVMVFSGLGLTGNTNTTVEFYTMGKGWSQPFNAPWTPPLYPRLHVLPNGNVFYSGSTTSSALFNPSNETWTQNVASTIYSGTRTYGSSVLMPLTPANGFKPRVMIFGGGSPATTTTEIIDLSVASPKWASGVAMSQARIEMNATLLPSGQILATGGSVNDEDASTESLNADIYDSVSGARSSAGANAFARLYHSNSLLLPDATVLLIGGNPTRGTYEPHMEIYTPAYLYNSSGQLATRPTITSVSSSVLGYNAGFTITTPNASTISSVVLIRAGAVTHAFDMDQRMVGLSFTAGSGVLNATTPTNGNLAPPGYYLLFILNSSGVPSVAQFVQLMTTPGTPPTGTITSPSSNVTIAAGQSVSFAGTGSAPGGSIASYDWVFPGGSPGSSTAASAGNVTFSTPGTYTASFTVTDNSGRTDPNPPTRTITVNPAFSISASPGSQTVAAGSGTSYTVTVTPSSGFSGTVSFSASGAPSGVTATFNPTTVTTSGSTTMSVTTTSAVAAGTYPLTINGSSSGVAVQTSVSLIVTGGSSGSGNITFVQGTYATPRGNNTSTSATFAALQTPGNLNVVIIGWNDSTSSVSSVTDTAGNVYQIAAGPTKLTGDTTGVIYYAKNILADDDLTDTVTVAFSGAAAYTDLRILEYAGADPSNPLDVGAGATGSGATASVTLTTTNARDLIVAGNYIENTTTGAGSGYTNRMITQPDTDIAEDEMFTTAGSHAATAALNGGWWVMNAAAFRALSGPPDTQAPTAPTSLTATAAGSSQINLSWTASTDNVGVTGYKVEQCQGASCSNFAQIAATTGTGTTYQATGLTAATSYSYRVRATDAAGNLSGYSNTASATTSAAPPPGVKFVQGAYSTPRGNNASVAATYTAAQAAGDLNIVVIGWSDTTATVKTVTDSKLNVYTLAVGPTQVTGQATQSIYYAKSIAAAAANANVVTVAFNGSANTPDLRILEYSGAPAAGPIDAVGSASGSSATASASVTTTNANDVILAADFVEMATPGPGAGFTSRMITVPDSDIVEDETVSSTGTFSGTAPESPAGWWVMQVIAIK